VGHAEFAQCDAPAGASYNGEVVVKGDDGTTRTLKYKKAMVATGASAAGKSKSKSKFSLGLGGYFSISIGILFHVE